ncbi:EAL and HDOD domain-containing protein [Marinospirillum alkaliphilum]|uniref:EAL and modified HD-GYP domain-containing signal transduction protein n=1 Tax=Marinospirillum alkaliphilum DSM 21637 TaxID=1122209 RepID=A0A1K1X271_9GAMM|nr:HDOD domain-containing protein [Marinospirillum alkaliphilum]SFX43768.1 EAL and modified HD-GYP domain-containing signal transduction protein [Marinospirillum alkaliphilum DSM 21637]
MSQSALPSDEARYCIALQPICDAQLHHVADELLYRAHGGALQADITDPLIATARACSAAFYEIGLDALVGSRQLYLNVSPDWLARPELLPLPVEQVVIELPEVVPDFDLVCNLRAAHQQGYRMAATLGWLQGPGQSLLELVDIVKVDVRQPQAMAVVPSLKAAGKTLLAAFIEQAEALQAARDAGFDLFQGYFYALPQAIQSLGSGPRRGNRAADMKLLRTLYDPEVDIRQLERLIVQDPHLCHLLFKRVNSASERRLHQISSVSQAITLLGLDKIRALTATLLLAANEPVKRLLVFQMLVRASMARQLASHLEGVDADMAFTTGLFSMMEQLEGVALEVLLKEAFMDPQVVAALLQHQGELGKILQVIESFEQASLEKRSQKQVEILNRKYLSSVAWAQDMMAMTEEN